MRNLLSTLIVLLSFVLVPPVQANISSETSLKIALKYAGRPFENFRSFASVLYFDGEHFFKANEHKSIGEFIADRALAPTEREFLFRLLGIYAQLKYGGDAIRSLGEFVAIPTHQIDGIENHNNKHFKRFEKKLRRLAKKLGLKYRNVDNRVYEISIKGGRGKLIGLHAHADVVPANADNWVLDDGTKLDPFVMTRIGNRLYGRGTQDDKNGIVAVMYAMRILKEEKIGLWNNIKLLIDTTEETTSTAIPYYFERNSTPDYNIALDGDYPVVIAEKGFAVVKTVFPSRQAGVGDVEFVSLTGGLAYNQIPAVSQTLVLSETPSKTKQQLTRLGEKFVASYGGDFSVSVEQNSRGVLVKITGVSAHSSAPESGVNPISRLLLFIDFVGQNLSVKRNHISDAALYASQNWGIDFLGRKFGIDFEHDFMGPLTAAFTKVSLDPTGLELAVNLRIPVGRELTELEALVREKISGWQNQTKVDLDLSWRAKEPMYRDPKGKWAQTLLSIASESLELPREFGSSAGGTSIHFLPNGVQFGLSMPDEKYTGHNANEFKTVDQFLLDLQIVTEMLVRIGQMNNLE